MSHVEASLGDLFLVGSGGRTQEIHRSIAVWVWAGPARWVPVDGRKERGWKSHLEGSARTGVPF